MSPVVNTSLAVIEFTRLQTALLAEFGCAMGCTTFAMGVTIGTYLLLDRV